MNDDALNQLLACARAAPPPDTSRSEFGFETRLLANLRAERLRGTGLPLAWKLCPWFAAVVAALAVWTFTQPPDLRPLSIASQSDDLLLTELLTGTIP
jgi:hypothetical protein